MILTKFNIFGVQGFRVQGSEVEGLGLVLTKPTASGPDFIGR
jgi:hypothetical protein